VILLPMNSNGSVDAFGINVCNICVYYEHF
jgi:hypothetical protein